MYVFEGARGGFLLHVTDKTVVDPALKPKIKAGNSIVFTTAEPIDSFDIPDITAASIKSVVERIL